MHMETDILMRKYILLGPAGEVEFGPHWKKLKTVICEMRTAFALQHFIKPQLQLMQMQDVRGRVLQLFLAQGVCTPVR